MECTNGVLKSKDLDYVSKTNLLTRRTCISEVTNYSSDTCLLYQYLNGYKQLPTKITRF